MEQSVLETGFMFAARKMARHLLGPIKREMENNYALKVDTTGDHEMSVTNLQ